MSEHPKLTSSAVHTIRISSLTDSYWARLLNVGVDIVRRARIGETWKRHETPPDTAPRISTGRSPSPNARVLPIEARSQAS